MKQHQADSSFREESVDRPNKRIRLDGPSHTSSDMATPMEEQDDFADIYDDSPQKPENTQLISVSITQTEVAAMGREDVGTPIFSDTSDMDEDDTTTPPHVQMPTSLFKGEGVGSNHLSISLRKDPRQNFENSDREGDAGEEKKSGGSLNITSHDNYQNSPSVQNLKAPHVQTEELFSTKDETKELKLADQVSTRSLDRVEAVTEEYRFDSSDAQSSSSDDSTSSSSHEEDSDDDVEDEEPHNHMSLEEQAKLLMAAEGDGHLDSDDEEGGKKGDRPGGQLRTQNELPDEPVQKPDVEVTPEMKIVGLGAVESIVGKLVLIKANVSGEYQVLEEGSALCLADRRVIGVVADLLGRVQNPRYSVRFNSNEEIQDFGITPGMEIFYVESLSTFVFTKPLQNMKGSDASNLYDEEVGVHEMEFSDDEAEAEHKRQLKLKRQGRGPGVTGSGNGRARGRGHHSQQPGQSQFGSRDVLDYDERPEKQDLGDLDDDLYTPLARPSNYHELMNHQGGPRERKEFHGRAQRGDRGGRGGRHDRGRGRGGRNRGPEYRNRNPQQKEDHSRRPGYGKSYEAHEDSRRGHETRANDPHQANNEYNPRIPMDSTDYDQIRTSDRRYEIQLAGSHRPYDSPPQSHINSSPFYAEQQSYVVQPQPHHVYSVDQRQPPSTFPYVSRPAAPQSFYPPEPRPEPRASPINNAPAGAYINPVFFDNQRTAAPAQWSSPLPRSQWPSQYQQQWSHQPFSPNHPPPPSHASSRMSPEAEAASRAAQEKLDILRSLTRSSGSPT